MTGAPLLRAAAGGVSRHLVQTMVVFLALAASTAAAVLGVTLLTSANELFDHAVAAQHGADLAVTIDTAQVSTAQLAAARHAAGVTRAAGPYPEATVTLSAGPAAGGGLSFPGLTVVGRASRSGPLDDLTLNQGQWATLPGEIDLASYQPLHVPIGSLVTVASAPGQPELTVVGYAGSVVRDEDAWVTPGQAAALRPRAAPGLMSGPMSGPMSSTVQMLYTFRRAGTGAQLSADLAAVRRVLPAGAVTGTVSWLPAAAQTSAEQSVNTSFVVAFALLGLALAGLIVAGVVSGAVLAGYHRIGVLKSIGFTPAQVATAYLAQLGLPTVAGCAAGTALGNYWVLPELNNSAAAFHLARQTVPLWINVAVPLGMGLLAELAALGPALRAGRLSATAALTAGMAARAGHRPGPHRLAGRVMQAAPLPRPVSIGLAAPFARPARSAATLAVLTFGLAAVVLAVGLDGSLARVNGSSAQGAGQVQIDPAGRPPAFTAAQAHAITAALRAQPGTRRYLAEADLVPFPGARRTVSVPGVGQVAVTAYDGRSGWLGWPLISGRWYQRPGEVDAGSAFLTQSGLAVGDRITLRLGGRAIPARIVGQVFDLGRAGLLTGWPTLGGAAAGLAAAQYDIGLRPGTSPRAYAAALSRSLGGSLGRSVFVGVSRPGAPGFDLVDTGYIRVLTGLIAVLAGLGVLNSVLLAARERVRDLGVFQAVGMTPRQALAMVSCWVVAPAIGAAALALPAGMLIQDVTVRAVAADIGLPLPGQFVHVYTVPQLLLLALAGLGMAVAGALLTAGWAALRPARRAAAALRAE
jgi:putative ABC transport system permease protein